MGAIQVNDPKILRPRFTLGAWLQPSLKNWTRTLALGLSGLMLGPYIAWAWLANPERSAILAPPAALADIPASWGHLTQHGHGSGPWVLHIQDLDYNYTAQLNIVRLLGYLAQTHKLPFIGIEGASRALDISQLHNFPLTHIRYEISQNLVQRGMISGPEYFAATSRVPIQLVGLETPELYTTEHQALAHFLNAESQGICLDLHERLKKTGYHPTYSRCQKRIKPMGKTFSYAGTFTQPFRFT